MKISATVHIKCDSCKKITDVERELIEHGHFAMKNVLDYGKSVDIAFENGFHIIHDWRASDDRCVLLCDECYHRLYKDIQQQIVETE